MLTCLVNTPGAAIERPSIGLSTLKSVLTAVGHNAIVSYANIWHAEHAGLDVISSILETHTREGLFDWLFAAAAFPEFRPEHEEYLEQCLARCSSLRKRLSTRVLLELRESAAEFVDAAADRLLRSRPAIVGCTSTFSQHVPALALLRRIREIAPSVITMLGGANCESIMGRTTHKCFGWVDYVVSGEAEELIVPLINAVAEHGRWVPAGDLPHGVFGPVHRTEGYPRQSTGDGVPRAVIHDMGVVPAPDYSDFFTELKETSFRERVRPGLLFETSRGCWWGERSHCTFCGLNGGSMRYRAKSPDVVLLELTRASEKYGIHTFEAVDNILEPQYFETLLPRLAASGLDLELFYEIKADLRRADVEQLARAGIRWVQPGLESLDGRVLRLTRKGCTAWHNVALLKWFRQYGVRTFWNILYGVPGECDAWYADQARLIPFLHHLEPCTPSQVQYSRYSPYFTDQARFGLALRPAAPYRSIYPVSEEDLSDLVYFFDHEGKDGSPAETPGATAFMIALILWRRAWTSGSPPVCGMVKGEKGTVILDTRACAVESETAVTRLCADMLDMADDGVTREQLRARSTFASADGEEVERALEFLVERGFLVEIGGRVVSVVSMLPLAPLPDGRLFPGGAVKEQVDSPIR